MNIKFLIFFFIIFIFSFNVNSKVFENVEVSGNSRISTDSIKSIINFKKKGDYTFDDINNFQKKLFETNFFKQIKIDSSTNILKIIIEENPVIDFFFIKGVKNNKREELIYENINLGNNKIFSDISLQKDINIIKDIYAASGYYNVTVLPRVSKLDGNAVNLVIDIVSNEKIKIKNIFFIGDKKFKTSQLQEVISSTTYGWWRFFSNTSDLNDARLELDKSLLRNFYLNNGYYDVQILTSDIEIINNSVNLIYSINAGEKYSFSKFEINDSFNILNSKNIDEIREIIKKDYDGFYSKSKINKIENAVNNYLNLKKIQFFRLNISTNIIEDKKVLTKFDITKTDRKFVNLINISGNQITEEKFIRGLLPISEGDTLPQYKVNESKRNLINSGIFKKVSFDTEFVDNELFNVDISVEEQPTGSISAGIGIGSVESSVGAQIQERNLFGKGIVANGNLNFGTQRVTGSFNTDIPDFLNSNNTVGFGLIATTTEYDNAGYESSKYGASTSLKYNLYEDISIRPGFGLDFENVSALSNASDLTKKQAGDYFTMKGFYTIANDKRNRSFFTTDGHRVAFSQTLGLPGSEIPYINNELSGSFYETLLPGYTFSLKGQLEGINSLNNKDIKLSDRKYLTNRQLRGFENFATGPKEGTRYIGGNYSANASISTTFPNPLPEKYNLNTLTFLDIGNIWGVDYDSSLDNNKLRSSIGIGVDWISPIGPLSFTFAEVLSKSSSDLEESFSFQIGSSF